jgi:tetratricopeptide (TPR) repeat protein
VKAARLLPCFLLGACAYFNGIYNSRSDERRGDALRRAGRDDEAIARYAAAAAAAETVLARYPRSRWADDALYLAGRGAAYAGRCEDALPRLDRYLERPRPTDLSRRARLARAICYTRVGRQAQALSELRALLALRDRAIAADASLWAGRAALAAGDRAAARSFFATRGASVADWEMLPAAIADSDGAELEALIMRRAAAGDWRGGAGDNALRALAATGGVDAVDRVVARLDGSGVPFPMRMRTHILAADLAAESGREAVAQDHLARARRLGADSAFERAAAARVAALSLRGAPTLEALERVMASNATDARRSDSTHLEGGALLVRVLARRAGGGAAALFLAGEVARDSLAAPALALHLFRRAADAPGDPAAAAQALLAAAALAPDSASAYFTLVRTRFVGTPAAMLIDGRDPADSPEFEPLGTRLRTIWAGATLDWADSLRVRRGTPARSDSVPRATPPA